MQNHGSDAYSVRKKLDSISKRLKLHTRQAITEGTRVLWNESAHRLRTKFNFAKSFDEPGPKDAQLVSPFLSVGTRFRTFVRKFGAGRREMIPRQKGEMYHKSSISPFSLPLGGIFE